MPELPRCAVDCAGGALAAMSAMEVLVSDYASCLLLAVVNVVKVLACAICATAAQR